MLLVPIIIMSKNPNGVDDSGNYYNSTITSNVTLAEQFNPLLKIDLELKIPLNWQPKSIKTELYP